MYFSCFLFYTNFRKRFTGTSSIITDTLLHQILFLSCFLYYLKSLLCSFVYTYSLLRFLNVLLPVFSFTFIIYRVLEHNTQLVLNANIIIWPLLYSILSTTPDSKVYYMHVSVWLCVCVCAALLYQPARESSERAKKKAVKSFVATLRPQAASCSCNCELLRLG